MAAPLLLDLSHTAHTRARTGVQRVTRSLHATLGSRAVAITHDPHRGVWRELDDWERENLRESDASAKRGARWPLRARLQARAQKILGRRPPVLPVHSGVLVPEIFSPEVGRALPALFTTTRGPHVAVFHDAIALKLPELSPASTVARFPAYLVELLRFEAVAAVSDDSRASLLDYWKWLGVAKTPHVRAIPLGVIPQPSATIGENLPATGEPIVLSIGSIEGRKNHVALLDACAGLWERGEHFRLHLIGLAHAKTGANAMDRIQKLQALGRPLVYHGAVSDAKVDAAYAEATFTVYPSLMEGFGLPVIESLAHGKPCICSNRGALGESARRGGCLTLDNVDVPSLEAAISRLLHAPSEVARLSAEARSRRFKSWSDYADEIEAWMKDLRSDRLPPRHHSG